MTGLTDRAPSTTCHLHKQTAALAVGTLLLVASGCAHSQSRAQAASKEAPKVHFRDDQIGVSVDLPAEGQFKAGQERGTIAEGADTTEVRLFLEFVNDQATDKACWQQLFEHIPSDLTNGPKTPEELATMGRQGLQRQDRLVFLSVHPQENRCYVVMVDGPKQSPIPQKSEASVEQSFKVEQPSAQVASDFEIKAGVQALSAKDYDAALSHFQKALKLTPDNVSARYGAGLSAYFSGPSKASMAIEYFKPILETPVDEDLHEGARQVQQEQLRDALMYTGLAYAALHDYKQAENKLVELTDRFPDDGIARYNLACVLALAGDATGALGELSEALKREPSLAEHARTDDDLKSLRSTGEWKALVERPTEATPPAPH